MADRGLTGLDRQQSGALFGAAGKALYGTYWAIPMAAALGVSRRTVDRWHRGKGEPGPQHWETIRGLLLDRAGSIGSLLWRLSDGPVGITDATPTVEITYNCGGYK